MSEFLLIVPATCPALQSSTKLLRIVLTELFLNIYNFKKINFQKFEISCFWKFKNSKTQNFELQAHKILGFLMIITVASFKGGQAKTTSAVHLAAYFSKQGKTLLIDGDPNRSASSWAKRKGLPFMVCDERQAARYSREYEHIVIDTQARPTAEDLQALAEGCDLLIVPCTPDALSLDALFLIVEALEHLGSNRFRILLTIIPPKPSRDGEEALATLNEAGLPVFKSGIRRFVAFQKAALHGVPVYEVSDPKAEECWQDYVKVGEEICNGQ